MKLLSKLDTAISEADRFVKRAKAARAEIKEAKKDGVPVSPSKNIAAAKRASMDLSNALAELRKTGNYEP